MTLEERAKEIADFLEVSEEYAVIRLSQGFHHNHHLVAEDFNKANISNDDELLEWYRTTTAYIWELTAYHLDPGFNYMGMCQGIIDHLKSEEEKAVAIFLGDGVGDLSLMASQQGLWALYHDLQDSRTAEFAKYRFHSARVDMGYVWTETWEPTLRTGSVREGSIVDAVVALDFFEHLVNVEEWTRAVYEVLRPGGLFLAQNAFAIGDDDHGGSIPMHLTRNNRFEKDWYPLLESIGFEDQKNGWWKKV